VVTSGGSLSERVIVVGTSGAGKTTLAGRIAARLGIEHIEIDALFHGPGWTPRPEFLEDVRAFAGRDAWVTEWQYEAARPVLLERATLAVWLDYPVWLRMSRSVCRTVRRRLRRAELWNGNREGPLWRVLVDDDHIIRWAWRTRHKYDDLRARLDAEGRADLPLVRLRSQAQADAWLAGVGGQVRG
jgi:adenylate kinase family enzyme